MPEMQQGSRHSRGRSRSSSSSSKSDTFGHTKIIDRETLEHTGSAADEERAMVVGDGDHQRAAQADHEVGHG